ncbi:hypothetical protein [Acidihalobacter aeolianus]|uniref:hypothetical protein n=1 Tax=Acidihalobacter aeolianus TaxID=2792603 RepID=UPI0012EAB84A|nr:hypothetical protein [Acidihalobacter aeolianus]
MATRSMGMDSQFRIGEELLRFDWTVDAANAFEFHRKPGATRVADKLYFRLSSPDLEAHAKKQHSEFEVTECRYRRLMPGHCLDSHAHQQPGPHQKKDNLDTLNGSK